MGREQKVGTLKGQCCTVRFRQDLVHGLKGKESTFVSTSLNGDWKQSRWEELIS